MPVFAHRFVRDTYCGNFRGLNSRFACEFFILIVNFCCLLSYTSELQKQVTDVMRGNSIRMFKKLLFNWMRASGGPFYSRHASDVVVAAFCVLLTACSAPPQGVTVSAPVAAVTLPDTGTTTKSVHAPIYLIGMNDELEIKFIDQPQLNESAKVRPDGMISLGLIGTV